MNNKKFITVGLTGNIGCGKSSVSDKLISYGYPVVDGDLITKNIYKDKKVVSQMETLFPESVINGKVDKKVLAEIVFNDKNELKKLNNFAHRIIKDIIIDKIEFEKHNSDNVVNSVIIDAALLVEAGYTDLVDKLVVVYCNEDIQIKRVMDRDGLNLEEVKIRVDSQMSQNEKIKSADYIIDNSGSIEELETKVDKLIKEINKWKEEKVEE